MTKPYLLPSLSRIIHEALGEASVCWSNVEGAGEFQSSKAIEIAERVINEIRADLVSTPSTAAVSTKSAEVDFPYQQTFNAIADATTINTDGSLGISVKAFQDSFNGHLATGKGGDLVHTVYVVEDDFTHIFSTEKLAKEFADTKKCPCVISTYLIDNPERFYEAVQ